MEEHDLFYKILLQSSTKSCPGSLSVELYDRDYWLYGKVKLITIYQLVWDACMKFSITANMVHQFKQE